MTALTHDISMRYAIVWLLVIISDLCYMSVRTWMSPNGANENIKKVSHFYIVLFMFQIDVSAATFCCVYRKNHRKKCTHHATLFLLYPSFEMHFFSILDVPLFYRMNRFVFDYLMCVCAELTVWFVLSTFFIYLFYHYCCCYYFGNAIIFLSSLFSPRDCVYT